MLISSHVLSGVNACEDTSSHWLCLERWRILWALGYEALAHYIARRRGLTVAYCEDYKIDAPLLGQEGGYLERNIPQERRLCEGVGDYYSTNRIIVSWIVSTLSCNVKLNFLAGARYYDLLNAANDFDLREYKRC